MVGSESLPCFHIRFDMTRNLVYKMTMIKLNIHEAKTHLSRYLARLKKGETIVLCRRNTPVAEIRPLPVAPRKRRPIGLARNQFRVPPSFFEPLPEEIIEAFHGQDP